MPYRTFNRSSCGWRLRIEVLGRARKSLEAREGDAADATLSKARQDRAKRIESVRPELRLRQM
jgi:hypothetical protein